MKKLHVWQILEGDVNEHPSFNRGLISLCEEYMRINEWSEEHKATTNRYLEFLRQRARGTIPTGAKFIREFVLKHPLYQRDSIVSKEIAFDLVSMLEKLESSNAESASLRQMLLGDFF